MEKRKMDSIIDQALTEQAPVPAEAPPAEEPVMPAGLEVAGDEEFDVEPDVAGEEPEEEYPSPRYTIQNAIDTLRGLLNNWHEVRVNFPPNDPRREEVTGYGDVINGLVMNLERLSSAERGR